MHMWNDRGVSREVANMIKGYVCCEGLKMF